MPADGIRFQVVCDWSGVTDGRASSPFTRFGDANRLAMVACVERNRDMRVYAYSARSKGVLVAHYQCVNGRAQVVPID